MAYKYMHGVVIEDIVPASFTCTSLELSPSFRALAEELDDPNARPSGTERLQIEQELDQVEGVLFTP